MGLILILGMHRSGTSCLAGALQGYGLFSGEVHEWNPFNLKGNRENQSFVDMNDMLLSKNNSSWDRPPENKIKWTTQDSTKRDQLLKKLELEAVKHSATCWGFKDPRTLLVLPFWLESITDLSVIASFRHPISVANSLHQRSGMPMEKGLALWEFYNKLLLDYLESNKDSLLVCFDLPAAKYQADLSCLVQYVGLHSEKEEKEHFFDASLRNNVKENSFEKVSLSVKNIYWQLFSYYEKQFERELFYNET